MLKSQAWRRRAQKTFAVGSMGSLVAFGCSAFIMATPGVASADVTKTFSYTCQGTLLNQSNRTIQVGLSAPDSVTAGTPFDLKVDIPTLTLAQAPTAATTLQVNATLDPTPGSIQDPGAKTGASVTTSTSVPAKEVAYKVSVPAGTTGNVTVKPGQLLLSLASSANTSVTCTTTSTETLSVPIGAGNGNGSGTDVVEYRCVGPATTDTQDVEMKVEMTMPTSARTRQQFAIKWKGTYTQGKELKAPTGQTLSAKVFAYAALTGITGLTSATGEGATGTITPGQPITLPTSTIDLKSTANATGTVTVKPSKINFGTNAKTGNQPMIECAVQNESELKTYTFTVANGTASPSPSPSPTPSNTSPRPTRTSTHTVTITPSSESEPTRKSQTPKAGADTGAGGTMGPDGRLFILTGTAMIGAAAVGGLLMRRRSIRG